MRIPVFGVLEDDAVILVRAQGLLQSAFGTQSNPAETRQVRRRLRQGQFDSPVGGQIVESGYDLGQVFRRHALGQHITGQAAHVLHRIRQMRRTGGSPQGFAQLGQADALQGEQVFFRNQADQPFLFHHQHMPYAVSGHGQGCFIGGGVHGQGNGGAAHHLVDGARYIQFGQGDPVQQILQRKDAQGAAIVVYDDHGPHRVISHGNQSLANTGFRGANYRLLPDYGGQGCAQGLLFAGSQRVLCLDHMFGSFQQAGQTASAEIMEWRAGGESFGKIARRQQVAEGVFCRSINAGYRPICQQGAQGEAFSFTKLPGGNIAVCLGQNLLADHAALLDDEKMCRHALFRRQDDIALGVKGQF